MCAKKPPKHPIIGDMPIFIAQDGCDAWVNRELFRWDEHNQADPVSGAPPDAFSPMGQHWGNPLYNWEAHRKQALNGGFDRLKGELAGGIMSKLITSVDFVQPGRFPNLLLGMQDRENGRIAQDESCSLRSKTPWVTSPFWLKTLESLPQMSMS